jgi:hypothetical protein
MIILCALANVFWWRVTSAMTLPKHCIGNAVTSCKRHVGGVLVAKYNSIPLWGERSMSSANANLRSKIQKRKKEKRCLGCVFGIKSNPRKGVCLCVG